MTTRKRIKIMLVVGIILIAIGLTVFFITRSDSFSTDGMTPLEIEYYSEMTKSERKRAIKIEVIDSEVSGETWVRVIKDGVDSDAVYVLELTKSAGDDAGSTGDEIIIVPTEPFDPSNRIIVAEKMMWLKIV